MRRTNPIARLYADPRASRHAHHPLALLTLALFAFATQPASAGGGHADSGIYGALYPGKVIYGEPYELPPGWRAYPVSIFRDIYVIRPARRKARTNFNLRRHPRPHRRHARKGM